MFFPQYTNVLTEYCFNFSSKTSITLTIKISSLLGGRHQLTKGVRGACKLEVPDGFLI